MTKTPAILFTGTPEAIARTHQVLDNMGVIDTLFQPMEGARTADELDLSWKAQIVRPLNRPFAPRQVCDSPLEWAVLNRDWVDQSLGRTKDHTYLAFPDDSWTGDEIESLVRLALEYPRIRIHVFLPEVVAEWVTLPFGTNRSDITRPIR